jgi:hypothetical protein
MRTFLIHKQKPFQTMQTQIEEMNTQQHTSAPWSIHTCKENGPSLDSFYLSTTAKTWDGNEEERIVCRFPTGTGQFSDMGRENLANARLISSAPDLLDALDWALRQIEDDLDPDHQAAFDAALSTLAKAKGEAK